jgi:predicted nucleic acid-binding protein
VRFYAESSAVVAILLGESQSDRVRKLLASADAVAASDLTLLESARVLIRAVARGEMSQTSAAKRLQELDDMAASWGVLRIGSKIVERARKPFPREPIRALDAIHLASALAVRVTIPDLQILSLDDRIRSAASQLGFRVQPS